MFRLRDLVGRFGLDVMAIAGLGLVATGCALVALPLGLIVLGLGLLATVRFGTR